MSRVPVRYYFAGEPASNGRILHLPYPPSSAPTAAALLDLLSATVDLTHFTPHVHSSLHDAWAPLTLDHLLPAAARRLDVRLHATATRSPPAADPPLVTCDSSALLSASFFGVGIVRGVSAANHGSVWRTALQLGAAFTFTVGAPYSRRVEGGADVYKAARSIPCVAYADETALDAARVVGAEYVAVEYGGESLAGFAHPRRAVYLLGGEKEGLDAGIVQRCKHHVSIGVAEGRPASLNVAAAAAIVLWDRKVKMDARG